MGTQANEQASIVRRINVFRTFDLFLFDNCVWPRFTAFAYAGLISAVLNFRYHHRTNIIHIEIK